MISICEKKRPKYSQRFWVKAEPGHSETISGEKCLLQVVACVYIPSAWIEAVRTQDFRREPLLPIPRVVVR